MEEVLQVRIADGYCVLTLNRPAAPQCPDRGAASSAERGPGQVRMMTRSAPCCSRGRAGVLRWARLERPRSAQDRMAAQARRAPKRAVSSRHSGDEGAAQAGCDRGERCRRGRGASAWRWPATSRLRRGPRNSSRRLPRLACRSTPARGWHLTRALGAARAKALLMTGQPTERRRGRKRGADLEMRG